jgi:hypothetical protein
MIRRLRLLSQKHASQNPVFVRQSSSEPNDSSRGVRAVQRQRVAVAAGVAIAALGVTGTAWAASRAAVISARAARSLTANDEGRLRLVGESGADLIEEGPVTGTLPGSVRVSFSIGPTVTATFTLYPRGGGSISGRGSGALHSSGRYASFGGTMTVSSGTARYRHARGTGGFYGTINRRTYAVVVQTRGTLHY